MKAVCVDASGSLVLDEGREYFVFPGSPSSFYVSKFDNDKAHFGCFQADRFQVVEDKAQEPDEVVPDIDNTQRYKAKLIFNDGYTKPINEWYYLKPRKTHAAFYLDQEFNQFGGIFPLWWFDEFQIIEPGEEADQVIEIEIEPEQMEQLSFFGDVIDFG